MKFFEKRRLLLKRIEQFKAFEHSKRRSSTRFLKYAVLGGSVAAGVYYWPEISFFGQAVNRVYHTASAVALLAVDYKWTLGSYWKVQETRKLLPEEEKEYVGIKSEVHARSARRLLALFQRNGGIYIKLGQHLSALDFILPDEYCRVMSTLQNEAPASPPEDVCLVFQEELGAHFPTSERDPVKRGRAIMESCFRRFDWRPIGAASLAQVHVAERHDGERVAVKIQHRRVLGFASLDMATASVAVKWIKRVFPNFEFSWLAEEIRTNLPRELNFLQEGHNAERLAKYQEPGDASVVVPRVHWDLSTRRILVMEFMEGEKISNVDKLRATGIDLRKVGERLTKAYSEMIFVHGFVHCDPHPGNILVRRSAQSRDGYDLVLLDHGLYKELSDEFRVQYARLWKAVVDCDEPGIAKASEYFGNGNAHRLFSSVLTHRSWDNLGTLNALHSLQELQAIKDKVPFYLERIARLLAALPRDMLLLLKTNDLLRSIERRLQNGDSLPSRSFLIMARYCALAIEREEEGRVGVWRAKLRYYRSLVRYRLIGCFLKIYSFFSLPAKPAPSQDVIVLD